MTNPSIASDLIERLDRRASIRRQIPGRKSVQEGAPDRIADLLEEASSALSQLTREVDELRERVRQLGLENGSLRHYAESCDEEISAWRGGRGPEYVAEMEALGNELTEFAEALSRSSGGAQ